MYDGPSSPLVVANPPTARSSFGRATAVVLVDKAAALR
jgi:hypothetical protein